MDTVHRRANFPSNLEIPLDAPSAGIPTDERRLAEDVEAFGIAAKTWEASFELLDYLIPAERPGSAQEISVSEGSRPVSLYQPPSPLPQLLASRHPRIIDLGSGTCHLAIGLARRLAQVHPNHPFKITVSDLPEVLPLLQRNISSASTHHISARALAWGDIQQTINLLNSPHEPISDLLITCSDLVFFPFLFVPLLRSLLILTSPQLLPPSCATPVVLFGYKERTAVKEFPFFSLLGRYFKLEPILSRSKPTEPWELTRRDRTSQDEGSKIYLLRATRHHSTLTDSNLLHSIILNDAWMNHEEGRDPLLALGDHSACDQWEWILLSNLSDHQLFS